MAIQHSISLDVMFIVTNGLYQNYVSETSIVNHARDKSEKFILF